MIINGITCKSCGRHTSIILSELCVKCHKIKYDKQELRNKKIDKILNKSWWNI